MIQKNTIGILGSVEHNSYDNGLERLGQELYNSGFYYIRAFSDIEDSNRTMRLIMNGYTKAYISRTIDKPDEGVFATYPSSKNTYELSDTESFFGLNNGNGIEGVILFGGNVGLEIAARYIYINKIPAVALTCFGGAAQQIVEKHFDPYRRGSVITGISELKNLGKGLKDKLKLIEKIEQ